ncbi:MAG: hypothetical protein IKS49_04645 [Actinomycetaceae bacterium]|nr:hypothetical protein [Actinomycetaceae bacterium]
MQIRKLEAEEASSWAWDAANSIVETRMASGGLSRAGTTSLTRSVISAFDRRIPFDTEVWVDDAGGWIWLEYADDARVVVRAGFLAAASDVNQWAAFLTQQFSQAKIVWRVWGEKDSLVDLVETLGAMPIEIVLRASIAGLDTPEGASDIWLRAMGAAELKRFKAAIADERAEVLVALGKCADVDEGRREALQDIEEKLVDGVASPGHYLYTLFHEGRVVGGVWMENDGGTAIVHSIALHAEERRQGHRRAAVGALVNGAHGQGARQIEITVLPSDYNFLDALLGIGMDIISVDYVQEPDHATVLQGV